MHKQAHADVDNAEVLTKHAGAVCGWRLRSVVRESQAHGLDKATRTVRDEHAQNAYVAY